MGHRFKSCRAHHFMKKNYKYFNVKCQKCKKDIKVLPEIYRNKSKVTCDACLDKVFDKFKYYQS